MARAYKVIDADGHILEPIDLWDRYMDPAYRERAPRLIIGDNGKERLLVEGKILGNPKGLGRLGAVGARDGSVPADTMMYKDGRPGGFDPHERIKDLDLDGIDAAFLYPSIGLFSGAVQDPKLAAAMCRAYNRWLADYCKPYPDRLFGIAMLPMQSVDLAIEEMRFARKQLGMKGGFLRPNPYNGRMANHPDYDPFWAEAQELDFSIGFHEGASGGMPTVGVDRFEGRGARHIISHTMEMMLVALAVIWGGTCERFPKIRIGFLESGGGWIAPWLDRMDRHCDGLDIRLDGDVGSNVLCDDADGVVRYPAGPERRVWLGPSDVARSITLVDVAECETSGARAGTIVADDLHLRVAPVRRAHRPHVPLRGQDVREESIPIPAPDGGVARDRKSVV